MYRSLCRLFCQELVCLVQMVSSGWTATCRETLLAMIFKTWKVKGLEGWPT